MARALAVLFLAVSPAAAVEPVAADLIARTDAVFADVARPGSPGCALGVLRGGELVYSRGFGLASLEWSAPITTSTRFDIGSVSKQFTAAVVILLAAAGKLSLDDDVRRWIPELPDRGSRITLRHLIHHTSGLRDHGALFELAGFSEDDVLPEDAALAMAVRQKRLNYEPGAEFSYCNTGYFLLSVVAKRAGGKPLRALAEELLFRPLGMTSTTFRGDHTEVIPGLAMAYEPQPDGAFGTAAAMQEFVGDGGLLSTVEDLARWQRNFVDAIVGGPGFVASMTAPGTLRDGTPLAYASGLMLGEHRGLRYVRHRGYSGGYRADILRIPEKSLDVILLCNHAAVLPDARTAQVADVWLGEDRAAPAPVASAVTREPTVDAGSLAGRYRNPESGDQRMIVTRAGKLYLPVGGTERELAPVGGGRFRLSNPAPWPIDIVFDGPRFRWQPELGAPIVYERFEPVKPAATELRALAGRYRSEELDSVWTLSFEEGALFRRARFGASRPLVPAVRDEFRSDGVTLRFRRDRRGYVTGFVVSQGRIRDVEFVRAPGRR